MKRILICFIVLIGFATFSSISLSATGYNGNDRVVKTEVDSYIDLIKNDELVVDDIVENVNNNGKTDIVYDILLFEFSDYNGYYSTSKINNINSLFNDNNPSNSIYSVHEFYQDLTYGKVSIYANIYLFKDKYNKAYYDRDFNNLVTELATYSRAMVKATACYQNYSSPNKGSMIMFSAENPKNNDTRLWAHAYPDTTFVSLTYGAATVETMSHEILHTFSLRDLYTYSQTEPSPVESWDIMSDTYAGPINTLMYNKAMLGWAEVSSYEDSNATMIETIAQDGRYTLYPTNDQGNNTKAYKFGIKQGDSKIYFMAEYRKRASFGMDFGIKGSGLIVYRVNENKKFEGNLNKTYAEYETYLFRPGNAMSCTYAYYSNSYRDIGSLTDERYSLLYEDNSLCRCIISNITLNSDGTLSFDFTNYQNKNIISGVVKTELKVLSGIKIYADGTYVTSTASNGTFLIENYNYTKTLSFVDESGTYSFKPVTIAPNTIQIEIYPYKDTIKASIIVKGSSKNAEYALYKSDNGNRELVSTFKINEYVSKNLKFGNQYVITGLGIDDYYFNATHDQSITLYSTAVDEVKDRNAFEKAYDSVVGFIDDAGNAISGAINTTVESIQGGIDAIGRGYDYVARKFGDLF